MLEDDATGLTNVSPITALAWYRENTKNSSGYQKEVKALNAMPIEDRIELVFHMLMANNQILTELSGLPLIKGDY